MRAPRGGESVERFQYRSIFALIAADGATMGSRHHWLEPQSQHPPSPPLQESDSSQPKFTSINGRNRPLHGARTREIAG